MKTAQSQVKKINHLGIAIIDENPIKNVLTLLGLNAQAPVKVPSQELSAIFLEVGESHLELLKPDHDQSVIGKFIQKKGSGIHHLCLEVEDIKVCLGILKENGVQLINPEPILGAHGDWVAFIHPKACSGILIELQQSKKGVS